MTWARVQPLGWALYEVLTSAQMNALDIDHTEAVDGVGGGTYTPTAPVIFGAGDFQAQPGDGDIVFTAGRVNCSAVSVDRYFPCRGKDSGGRFTEYSHRMEQSDITTAGLFEVGVGLQPNGGTVTGVAVGLKGAGGHAALPATPPTLELYRVTNGSASSVGGPVSDPSANTTIYQGFHVIPITGLSLANDTWTTWVISCTGETGANAATGLVFSQIRFTISYDKIYP